MAKKSYDIWIDISNTPQAHVARAIIKELNDHSVYITGWDRGETKELMKLYGIEGDIFGKDKHNSFLRSLSVGIRSFLLLFKAPNAKFILSFGNAMPIPAGKIKRMKILLMLDNDVTFLEEGPLFQRIQSRIKRLSNHVLVPKAAKENFERFFDNVIPYPGYKEHLYIADFEPNPDFVKNLPFEEYIVVRPESLTSLYVLHNKSLVPDLIGLFEKESINVIYLPRNKEERKLAEGFTNVYIPPKALDGLNLIYHSKATLTGSGTMAREAAIMGVPAVSFFPGKRLLAVDMALVEKKKMIHSREPKEIVEYVIGNWGKTRDGEFERAKKVKEQVISQIRAIIGD